MPQLPLPAWPGPRALRVPTPSALRLALSPTAGDSLPRLHPPALVCLVQDTEYLAKYLCVEGMETSVDK